jgi:glycosidase
MILQINLILFLLISTLFPQSFKINKIEPPNWWSGMKNSELQLMVYGENLNNIKVSSKDKRFKIREITPAQNSTYLFIDITLKNISSGNYELIFSKDKAEIKYEYPILRRDLSPKKHSGFSNEDIIYLIMADRFCDGNPNNNYIDDSLDQFTAKDLDGRRGGDIEGIITKLDYLKELGVNTIWVTPMLENNMYMSYHGYAATNLYRIDPRLGTNDLYKFLVDEAHKREIKIILDHVSNHIGINHAWMKQLPFDDWINGKPGNHKPANHNKMTFLDIHSDSISVSETWEGWFEDYMPDLNQRNEFLKNYLIQNTIWWIEYSGIDGIREDTYPYVDQKFLSEWAKKILVEYPNFNIVGEVWSGVPAFLAGYQTKSKIPRKFDSNLPVVTDFGLADALRKYLSGEKDLREVFNTFAQDNLYYDPNNLLVFLDNHDIPRALFVANQDFQKFKIALTLLLTTRGIPQIFYGTEIGIVGDAKHGNIRSPFPGGFNGDKVSSFTKEGRDSLQNNLFDYLQNLISLRKKYKSLSSGKLIHFYPFDNVYIYFKELGNEKIMVVVNDNKEKKVIDLAHVKHLLKSVKSFSNLNTNEVINYSSQLNLTVNGRKAELFKIIE